MTRPTAPPEPTARRRPHVAGLLVGAIVVTYALEALGALDEPFAHTRLAAALVLLLASLAGAGSRWWRAPLRDPARVRVVSALGLVTGTLGLVALLGASAEALSLAVAGCVLLVVLGAIHEAVAAEDRGRRRR